MREVFSTDFHYSYRLQVKHTTNYFILRNFINVIFNLIFLKFFYISIFVGLMIYKKKIVVYTVHAFGRSLLRLIFENEVEVTITFINVLCDVVIVFVCLSY